MVNVGKYTRHMDPMGTDVIVYQICAKKMQKKDTAIDHPDFRMAGCKVWPFFSVAP